MLLEFLLMDLCSVYIAVFWLRIFTLLIKVLQWLTLRFVVFSLRRGPLSQRSPLFTSVAHMHVLCFSLHLIMFKLSVMALSVMHVSFFTF